MSINRMQQTAAAQDDAAGIRVWQSGEQSNFA